jgi:hypothetical protein
VANEDEELLQRLQGPPRPDKRARASSPRPDHRPHKRAAVNPMLVLPPPGSSKKRSRSERDHYKR